MVDVISFQVVRIHTWDRQSRVIAKDTRGRFLSIPISFPIKFKVIKNNGQSMYSIENLKGENWHNS